MGDWSGRGVREWRMGWGRLEIALPPPTWQEAPVTSYKYHNWEVVNWARAAFGIWCVNKQVQGDMSDQYRATRIIRRIYCRVIGCKMTRVNPRTAEKSNKRADLEATVCPCQMQLKVAGAGANRAVVKRCARTPMCRRQETRKESRPPVLLLWNLSKAAI